MGWHDSYYDWHRSDLFIYLVLGVQVIGNLLCSMGEAQLTVIRAFSDTEKPFLFYLSVFNVTRHQRHIEATPPFFSDLAKRFIFFSDLAALKLPNEKKI